MSLADKNYKLTGCLVRTYDANGMEQFAKVANKGTVNYGQFVKMTQSAPDSSNKYFYGSMYKPTEVMILFKNQFTGEESTINSVGVDAEGNQTFVITNKRLTLNPATSKDQLLTTTYEVTKVLPYKDTNYYRYDFKKTYFSWNETTKSYETKTSSDNTYSLESLIDQYQTVTFLKK